MIVTEEGIPVTEADWTRWILRQGQELAYLYHLAQHPGMEAWST